MTATVTNHLQVAIPLEVCAELGIVPGVRLDFRARDGRLEAVKVSPSENPEAHATLAEIYTPERDAEEIAIQRGGSCEVPGDFRP